MMDLDVQPEIVNADCIELEAALRCGNSPRAVKIIRKLAEQKTKLNVEISNRPVIAEEDLIRFDYIRSLSVKQYIHCSVS